jgi:hypothetical protein
MDSVLAVSNNGEVPQIRIDEHTWYGAHRQVQYFTLMDSAMRVFDAHLIADVRGDTSAWIAIGITVGVALHKAPDSTRIHMAAASAALLRQMRQHCVPNAPADSVVCVQSGMFDRERRCPSGAT